MGEEDLKHERFLGLTKGQFMPIMGGGLLFLYLLLTVNTIWTVGINNQRIADNHALASQTHTALCDLTGDLNSRIRAEQLLLTHVGPGQQDFGAFLNTLIASQKRTVAALDGTLETCDSRPRTP